MAEPRGHPWMDTALLTHPFALVDRSRVRVREALPGCASHSVTFLHIVNVAVRNQDSHVSILRVEFTET